MDYNVVFITDGNYYVPTVVAIQSLIDSQPSNNKKYCIHVMYKDLSEKQVSLVKGMQTECFAINMIDVAEKYEMLNLNKLSSHSCTAKASALLKFEIADIFSDLDIILYLDGDIVVKGDISYVFEVELQGNYVGGVRDCGVATYGRKAYEHLNLNFEKYINSGVMILNLKRIREDNLREKLYEVKYKSGDKTKMDQNVFNVVFNDQIVLLPAKYNCTFPNNYLEHCYGNLEIEVLNKVYGENYESWKEVYENALIIHYCAPIKPWRYSDAILSKYWDEIFKRTPLSNKILQKRNRIHLNLLIKFCRGSRSALIVRTMIHLKTRGLSSTLKKVKKRIQNSLSRKPQNKCNKNWRM